MTSETSRPLSILDVRFVEMTPTSHFPSIHLLSPAARVHREGWAALRLELQLCG